MSADKNIIETKLREDRIYYQLNRLATWAGRIGGLAMIVGGIIAESKEYDGKIWMMSGAVTSLLAYVIHPYRQIQDRLEREINFLEGLIN